MTASSRGAQAVRPLFRRVPQICTQCAAVSRLTLTPATQRAYSASPSTMPVEANVTTPPVEPTLVPRPWTNRPKSMYKLKAGIILSRPPLLTREQAPFEQAFYLYQKRLNERLSTPFARQFYFKPGQPAGIDFAIKLSERGHTMERGIGRMIRAGRYAWDDELRVDKGYELADPDRLREVLYTEAESRVSEDGESLSFEDRLRIERPLTRKTEADVTNDVRRLDRKMDRTLYLVVRGKEGRWGFPMDNVRPDEDLHDAAIRALENSAGVNMNTWVIGRHPIAHQHREPVMTAGENEGEKRVQVHGVKIFYLKGRIMAGQADLTDNKFGLDDFMWLTKEELEKKLYPNTYTSVKNSMPSR